MKKQPWYRSEKFLYVLCFLLPPIGYIVVLSLKKKLSHEQWFGCLTVATLVTSIWVLKFLPRMYFNIIFLTGVGIYLYHKFIGKSKDN
ncbi:hypothetical protein U8V72_15205 [Priestia filamentosa]|uniref:hypothetical protein n=1 Tax=Priestia filamentosa TaxID=1402861 RepID=UPI0005896B76